MLRPEHLQAGRLVLAVPGVDRRDVLDRARRLVGQRGVVGRRLLGDRLDRGAQLEPGLAQAARVRSSAWPVSVRTSGREK